MSSSYRLKKRIEADVWNFGPYWNHYVIPWGECYPGDLATPIGRSDGVKVCTKNNYIPKDTILEDAKEGKKINGLYKSYNMYYPSKEFQNRPFNIWPEGGQDRSYALRRDYIKVPIRYNGTGLENMGQRSGEEFAYGWEVVNKPPKIQQQELPWQPQNFDITRLHSNQRDGDLRDELWNKYKHPRKTDYYHSHKVKGIYPNNLAPQYSFLPGSVLTRDD